MLQVRSCSVEEAVACSRQIPELKNPYPAAEYEQRLSGVPHLLLLAESDGDMAGFKAGYERAGVFYSWMGGVCPEYRRQGVAQALAREQENWAKAEGYRHIRFKTRNYLKPMLIFALNNGFYITAVEKRADPLSNRIWLEKVLI
ncbi:GNAT family N-acetyltransferase [Phaeodactylibacter sp.]|jgi:ribosomal protein S18 acetylase RimI-like enzyme|uniref:GNAT family N-acetyltransferase n=1 Tax=Phaeodactylibacter sp. TaxID=1940289 RepID=UPI0025D06407|nr:GNAT family N-acetyltransferase [Phaeodactylibacter sp.]MCI4647946.1 GNAT family N-acetyltransferase [Phaeodactylibacter sp.]MCI5089671.1 GNAT family N-acetyltransferase [Phaeodactylibacter sp.]